MAEVLDPERSGPLSETYGGLVASGASWQDEETGLRLDIKRLDRVIHEQERVRHCRMPVDVRRRFGRSYPNCSHGWTGARRNSLLKVALNVEGIVLQ